MPEPNKIPLSYGEQKRLTEKEKYRVLAEENHFSDHAKNLKAIPDQLDEETQISPDVREVLNSIADELEELNTVWKEYSTAYLDVTRKKKSERVKETSNMTRLLSGLNRIKKQMEAYKDNPVAKREEFAKCYARVDNIAGHYNEMTNGTLDVSNMTEEQRSKMITVKKDINVISESYLEQINAFAEYKEFKDGVYKEIVSTKTDYVDLFDTPLFSHEPTPDDIMQGNIGDCYFVSTLCAAAANNPQIIRDMMKDNGDGTVTVRLYDEKDNGKLEPMYINVEKSIPMIHYRLNDGMENELPVGSVDTLWVQMLEKAFAASDIHRVKGRKKISETMPSYADINSGFSKRAGRVLLGRQNMETEYLSIKKDYTNTEDSKAMNELFNKIKACVKDRNIIMTGSSSSYMSKELLNKYNSELENALVKNGKTLTTIDTDELQKIGKDIALKVFCGVYTKIDKDTAAPTLGNHEYTLIDAYERDGQKYVLVRNPHAYEGYKEGKDYSETDKGYCEIPIEKYAGLFEDVTAVKPLDPKYYHDFSLEYHSPLSKLYQGFLDSRSWRAKASFGMTLSKESSELKRVLQKIDNIQKERVPSKHSLMEAYKELDQAAKAYIEKHQNDNMAEMKDFTNRRLTIAKACRALSGSFLGNFENNRDVQADIHRIGRMMVTDRGVYVTQRVSKGEQVHPDAKGIFTDARVSNALIPVAGDKLFDIALTEHAHEIPSKVLEEVAKATNEKQTETVEQNAAVVENVNNIML